MKNYGQYCPVARASELFAERWTPILIRNMLAGCRTFTQLRDGAPGIPKALLSERLTALERHGIVMRSPSPNGRGWLYDLTPSGHALQPVCDALGQWGAQWLEVEPQHLDPAYVVWATTQLVDLRKVPEPGVTVRMDITDGGGNRFWLRLFQPQAEMCRSNLRYTEDLTVRTDARTLARWNLRQISFADALADGRIAIDGAPMLARGFPTWLRPSPFAKTAQPGGR